MSKLPKFYVGQKVIALRDQPDGHFRNGNKYEITGIKKGCCVDFLVSIGAKSLEDFKCSCCLTIHFAGEVFFSQNWFKPIYDDFQPITFEKIEENEKVCVN